MTKNDIGIIRMLTNRPQRIIDASDKIVNLYDGYVYEFIGIKWVKRHKAEREDYRELPQI